MINRVYVLTVPEERLPPDSETKPTGRPVPSDLPVQAVQRGPGIRQFVEEETSRVTGQSRTPGRRYLRRGPGSEIVLMLSIPVSEEERAAGWKQRAPGSCTRSRLCRSAVMER